MIVFFLNCYYNVILAWAFYYLFHSFSKELPWTTCGNDWNTPGCTTEFGHNLTVLATTVSNLTSAISDMTTEALNQVTDITYKEVDPTTEFWE